MIFLNKNLVVGIVVVLVIAGAGWYLLKGQMASAPATETVTPADSIEATAPSESAVIESSDSATTGKVKAFTVTGSNFKFDVPEIKVKTGDTVKITFKNAQGFHDFVIDEFKVKAKQANGPSEEVVTFVADKKGTYEYYCSVGQHRAMGMKGNLIVE